MAELGVFTLLVLLGVEQRDVDLMAASNFKSIHMQ